MRPVRENGIVKCHGAVLPSGPRPARRRLCGGAKGRANLASWGSAKTANKSPLRLCDVLLGARPGAMADAPPSSHTLQINDHRRGHGRGRFLSAIKRPRATACCQRRDSADKQAIDIVRQNHCVP